MAGTRGELIRAVQKSFDVVVLGLGAVGSAALYQLSKRGIKALGIDRFRPPHAFGSSHGDTRITRLALGEGPQYLPFARRSHEIWRELEAATGRTLLREVGGLIFGSTTRCGQAHGAVNFLQTTIDVARQHGIPHEVLESAELRARFPQFHFRDDERGCLEHTAGYVHPEECIAAQLDMAVRLGAQVNTDERVLHWKSSGGAVEVQTDRGRYSAAQLIIAAGAWAPGFLPRLSEAARVYRQVLFWFEPEGAFEWFTPEQMPVYIRVPDAGTNMFYGFPAIDGPGGGLKIAGEQFDQTTLPDETRVEVGAEEVVGMHAVASPHLKISSRCVRTVVCKYTVTPDYHFVIDRVPETDRAWFASACSGHGFKHSAAVGEALAEVSAFGRTGFDLSTFGVKRFDSDKSGLERR